MAYLTKEIFKSDWINLASADTSLDNTINRWITAVEKEMTGIISQPVEQESLTLYWFGQGEVEHNLYYTVPVTASTLKYRATPLDTFTTIATDEYVVTDRDGSKRLYYEGYFTQGYEWQFVATVGWATASVPADIQTSGYELLKEIYLESAHASQNDRFGLSGTTEGQAGTSFSKAIIRMRPQIEQRLAHYKLWRL